MEKTQILQLASVPEHSVQFMEAVSTGSHFVQDNYLCFSADDWLTIIGYPLLGEYSDENYLKAKNNAVQKTKATSCFSVAPSLPKSLHASISEEDVFYTLPIFAPIPKKLINPIEKAKENLRVELGRTFTAEHRRLWTEFMSRVPLNSMVRKLYISTAQLFEQNIEELYLLNAWDNEGHLVAALLLDFAPNNFCAYILGVHSKTYYVPHAHDLLFAKMIEISQEKNKTFIHLGLGVNEGITRFKKKWGAKKALPFVMAAWKEQEGDNSIKYHAKSLIKAVVADSSSAEILNHIGRSKWETWANLPQQRPYKMLWEVTKNGRTSWIGGSAHFFCYSFKTSFTKLFNQASTILFEGPLDAQSLKLVQANGVHLTKEHQPLINKLTPAEIQKLSRMVRGPEDFLTKLLNAEAKNKIDVVWYLENTRPWTALFTLWTGFLERQGWSQSVDMEAWYLAHDMGKTVVAMESLEEQLDSLNAVPPERVVRYFQDCDKWPKMIKKNIKNYLAGDLMGLMGTSAEFPTRTERIISMRDERFRQRMRPFIEAGGAVVFVGTAHMLNLRYMLAEDGFKVRQIKI